MDDEKLLGDFLLAIGVGVMAFALMVLMDDAPAAIQYDPPCLLEYQLTIIEELRCGQSDE